MTVDVAELADALVRSACSANVRAARALLDADPALARHDLACACVTGEAGAAAAMLARSPQLANRRLGPLQREPILYACFSRLPRAQPARAPGIRAVVELLLKAGADPNASFDQDGWLQVPLYGAAGIANDAQLTRMLLDAGADPNDAGTRPVGEALYHAIEFEDTTCAELLVGAGTDPQVVAHALGRALDFADPARVAMLCAHGVHATAQQLRKAVFRRRPATTVRMLLDAGAPVDEPDEHGLTALRWATRWSDREVADLLRERGANAAAVTDEDRALGAVLDGPPPPVAHAPPLAGATASELAAMLDMAAHAGDVETVARLLAAGAPVDGEPASEDTPLAQASWRGHAAVVRVLVAHGAALSWPQRGGSAIGAALHGSRHCHDPQGGPTMRTIDEVPRARYAEVVQILLDAGAGVPEQLSDGTPSATLLAELGLAKPAC